MRDELRNAMNEISDRHIAEAAQPPRRNRLPYRLGAMAAALALVMFAAFTALDRGSGPDSVTDPTFVRLQQETQPYSISAVPLSCRIAAPEYPEQTAYPDFDEYENFNDYDEALSLWKASQATQYDQADGYADSLETYFKESIPVFLDSQDENAVCSPLNIYMALAMLAETAGGNSRQQILDLLGADSIESLRTQAGQVWNAHYRDDGLATSLLGSSLWLDEGLSYNADVVKTLAESYYASVFQGDLGSGEVNAQLQAWLNENTRGLLADKVQNVSLAPNTSLALATTIYYQANWLTQFSEQYTTTDTFHGLTGDVECDFMHRTASQDVYYYGKDFGAVRLTLADGGDMWLILPDKGVTPNDLLEQGDALALAMSGGYWENQGLYEINISLPKFDVSADFSLNEKLKSLGVTDVFDKNVSDFSAINVSGIDGPTYLSDATHAARVTVDEKGVEAAAFTVMICPSDGFPPELEKIDFTLDRPFLFVVTSHDGLPLFVGTVYEP